MAIYAGIFSLYEKIRAVKLRNLTDAVNAHTHDGTNGVQISWSNIYPLPTFTQASFLDGSITWEKIALDTITINELDLSVTGSIHIDVTGYCLYA
jgi:hypothetical protein